MNSQFSTSGPGEAQQAAYATWPNYEEDELTAVTNVLRSGKVNYWTGDECRAFEKEYAAFVGAKHAIALANGTVALELALNVLGVGPGDEVVTSSRTYIASASCVAMRGARPVVADVDPVSQVVTAETIRAVLTSSTKAVIPVHLAGWPCDMDSILALAQEHDLKVIEDCAQAHGASYKGKPVGSFGDAAAFSFCQDKIITTGGEGGMLVLNDEALWKTAWAYKDIGRSYDAVHNREHAPGYRWLTESFGTNWRMTEIQAAIGRIQLRKLPSWVEKRRANAAILTRFFEILPGLRVAPKPGNIYHSYYKYYVFVNPAQLRPDWDRDRIMNEVNAAGIPCSVGSCSEIYLEKAFLLAGLGPKQRLPFAKELGETSLMFLVHPTLSDAALEETGRVVSAVMREASR
jgi:dTDP-4-amino-4,6-dideoxygalactose transaminase